MTAKEYLSQAYRLDQRINAKLEQVSLLRQLATKVTNTIDNEVVSHTRNVHSMEDAIMRIMDAENDLNRDIDTLVDLRTDISYRIRQVKSVEYQLLLEYRYILMKGWTEIADLLEREERYIYKLHGRALIEFEKVFSEGQ